MHLQARENVLEEEDQELLAFFSLLLYVARMGDFLVYQETDGRECQGHQSQPLVMKIMGKGY